MRINLNLLPEEKKEELKQKKIFFTTIKQEVLFLVPVLLFVFILLGELIALNYQKESVESVNLSQQSQKESQELEGHEKKFKQTNTNVAMISRLQQTHLHWTRALSQLSEEVPAGVRISNLTTNNYKIALAGKASTRENLITFQKNMEKSSCFINTNVPLSNLVVKENVDFQMDFEVKSECIHDKRI